MQRKGYSLFQVIIIIIITAIISGITVGVIFMKSDFKSNGVSYSTVINDEEAQSFLNTYYELINKYYKDIDKKELINSAIDGMANYLNESYTSFLDENASNRLIAQINGTYKGIGIVTIDNIVNYVEPNSPAYKAGIKSDDILTHINNVPVNGKSNNELSTIIMNENNVKIQVMRNSKELEFNIEVEVIDMPNVYYKVLNNKIGYIRINSFANNISDEVIKAILLFKEQKIDKLIIDLRDNSGGYLKSAKDIASIFTKQGDTIYSIDTQGKKIKYVDNDNYQEIFNTIILINKQTASAAEVLTSALSENDYAVLVGERTYGKGKVQHMYSLGNGSLLKYTSSLWYTPIGNNVDGIGITPHYYIENEKIYTNDSRSVISIKDTQLMYAEELLIKK